MARLSRFKNSPNLDPQKKLPEGVFFNTCFDKGELKNLVAWLINHYDTNTTLNFLERLKQVGFEQATLAGVSLGLDDLQIPPKKPILLSQATAEIQRTTRENVMGSITSVEKSQKMIDTWNHTSDLLRNAAVQNFRNTNTVNPVYMMAFSGARGNISQVRQLVGMRGLMADPQGAILEYPIQSNFREGLTLTEYFISCYGARKGLVDTALRTATAGYLTRRLVYAVQHIVVAMQDCGAKSGLRYQYQGKQHDINRLHGRVLAKDISISENITYSRNQILLPDMISQLHDSNQPIFIRSPLTCNAYQSVCQFCYGWNLAHGSLVQLGDAVGVIAAQSVGEPGTQLTMRTFHTGGVGVFAENTLKSIYAQDSGVISFTKMLPGQLIRTPHGKIAYMLKYIPESPTRILGEVVGDGRTGTSSTLQIFTELELPPGSLLFVKAGEFVHSGQIIAQSAQLTKPTENMPESTHPVYSAINGQILVENVLKTTIDARESFCNELTRSNKFLFLQTYLKNSKTSRIGQVKEIYQSFFSKIQKTKNMTNQAFFPNAPNFVDQATTLWVLASDTFYSNGYRPALAEPLLQAFFPAQPNQPRYDTIINQQILKTSGVFSLKGLNALVTLLFELFIELPFPTDEDFEEKLPEISVINVPFSTKKHTEFLVTNGDLICPQTVVSQKLIESGIQAELRTEKAELFVGKSYQFLKTAQILSYGGLQTLFFHPAQPDIVIVQPTTIDIALIHQHQQVFVWYPSPQLSSTTIISNLFSTSSSLGTSWSLGHIFVKKEMPTGSLLDSQKNIIFNTAIGASFLSISSRTFGRSQKLKMSNVPKLGFKKCLDRLPKQSKFASTSVHHYYRTTLGKQEYTKPKLTQKSSKTWITLSNSTPCNSAYTTDSCSLVTQALQNMAFFPQNIGVEHLSTKKCFSIKRRKRIRLSTVLPWYSLQNITSSNPFMGFFESEQSTTYASTQNQDNNQTQVWYYQPARRNPKHSLLVESPRPRKFLSSKCIVFQKLTEYTLPTQNQVRHTWSRLCSAKLSSALYSRSAIKQTKTKSAFLRKDYTKEVSLHFDFQLSLLSDMPTTSTNATAILVVLKPSKYADIKIFTGNTTERNRYSLLFNQFEVFFGNPIVPLPQVIGPIKMFKDRIIAPNHAIFGTPLQTPVSYTGELLQKLTTHTPTTNLLNRDEQVNHAYSLFTSQNCVEIALAAEHNGLTPRKLGDLIRFGNEIGDGLASCVNGQVVSLKKTRLTIQTGIANLSAKGGSIYTEHNQIIKKNDIVLMLKSQRLQTEDIVQGIPKIEQLFEARKTQAGQLVINSIHTKLESIFETTIRKVYRKYAKKYPNFANPFPWPTNGQQFPETKSVTVKEITTEKALLQLSKISWKSTSQIVRLSFQRIQKILVNDIIDAYAHQGVHISEKHVEVIVREMTTRVRILDPGSTYFVRGEVVLVHWVETLNRLMYEKELHRSTNVSAYSPTPKQLYIKYRPAVYEPIILGITKSTLHSESFLVAASFQQVSRSLVQYALKRKMDFLHGLHENVMVGQVIPTGFGLVHHHQIRQTYRPRQKTLWQTSITDMTSDFSRAKITQNPQKSRLPYISNRYERRPFSANINKSITD
jgi:hypothetical protein